MLIINYALQIEVLQILLKKAFI